MKTYARLQRSRRFAHLRHPIRLPIILAVGLDKISPTTGNTKARGLRAVDRLATQMENGVAKHCLTIQISYLIR
jgi:hypothetical protein